MIKRDTLHISTNGDISIQRLINSDTRETSYSIYYLGNCESKQISTETYEVIKSVLESDKSRLSTIESIKRKGSTIPVLNFLLVPKEKSNSEYLTSSMGTGFDSFFERVSGKSTSEFINGLSKLEEEMQLNLKKIEEDPSLRQSEEYLLSMNEQFKLSDNVLNDINRSETETTSEKGSKSIAKEVETKDEVTKLEVEYFENKNPKTFGFKGIAGMSDLKEELTSSFLKPLKFKFQVEGKLSLLEGDKKRESQYKEIYQQYEKFKISIPTGMLFYGPPGTGKTFITKKLAQELGAGLIVKSLGEFGSSYLHQTTVNITNFFNEAKKLSEKGPIILFLDEIDSLLSKRTNNIDSNKAEEVSQFLQEFNKLETAKNLIVIAATNRPDHLDPAILRSGRLDKKIYIGPPDYTARKELFEMYIGKEERPHEKLDYDELAKLSEGYVAADIETMCDEVSRDAGKNLLELLDQVNSKKGMSDKKLKETLASQKITMELLRQAIKDTHSSLKTTDMTIYDEWLKNIES